MTKALTEKLLSEMERYFGEDKKRINHAKRVTEFAQQILEREKGQPVIVVAAAVLHDIGIHEAERKYGSTSGVYQEKEGPPIARGILVNLGFEKKIIDEVCTIIASHHSPGEVDTLNFKIVYDADWLVNLKDEYNLSGDKLAGMIDKVFLTRTGKEIAKIVYLDQS